MILQQNARQFLDGRNLEVYIFGVDTLGVELLIEEVL
jgi:hypothetical protein